MPAGRAMLVVDDEAVVCQACRRIFSRQGFDVDVHTDARQGLSLAAEKPFDIILLDIKMPAMDGIQFLEHLRQRDPDVPVLIITGYPSIPNAAAAMRLGACDYVTKPFTTEEIISAVQRVLSTRRDESVPGDDAAIVGISDAGSGVPASSGLLFWDESWFRLEADGSAVVGAVMPGLRGVTPTEVRLPRIGEVVYQGLPMAGVVVPNKPLLTVPAPISGVVVAVNESLSQRPDWLGGDPCGEGWMACVCTTQAEDDAAHCRPRSLVLVNADADSASVQSKTLEAFGCRVRHVANRDCLLSALQDVPQQVVLMDAASLGDAGPEWLGLVNRQAPKVRVVVIASSGDSRETSYRKQKILYYAVEPFADGEMADILLAAFRGHEMAAVEAHKGPSEPISSIAITNREGHRVSLLAAPGLLWRHEGLGSEIGHKLLDKMLPVVITPGVSNLSTPNILKTATTFDRLMVLLANDRGLLPGSLARNTKPDFEVDPGEASGKVTTLSVQPDAMGGLGGLDSRTTAALADHIVREMVLS